MISEVTNFISIFYFLINVNISQKSDYLHNTLDFVALSFPIASYYIFYNNLYLVKKIGGSFASPPTCVDSQISVWAHLIPIAKKQYSHWST